MSSVVESVVTLDWVYDVNPKFSRLQLESTVSTCPWCVNTRTTTVLVTWCRSVTGVWWDIPFHQGVTLIGLFRPYRLIKWFTWLSIIFCCSLYFLVLLYNGGFTILLIVIEYGFFTSWYLTVCLLSFIKKIPSNRIKFFYVSLFKFFCYLFYFSNSLTNFSIFFRSLRLRFWCHSLYFYVFSHSYCLD